MNSNITMNDNCPDYRECLFILRKYGTPEHIIDHSIKVKDIALKLAARLNSAGFSYDIGLLKASAMLHDIARTESEHAKKGAFYVAGEGYENVAQLIACHMTHNFENELTDTGEADILCLADRVVKENQYVGLDRRMQDVLKKFENDPEAVQNILLRIDITKNLINQIEKATGSTIDQIAADDSVNIEPLLKDVLRPGRYINGEVNSVTKDIEKVATRFAFAFPDMYEIGMSYTGLQIIYDVLNAVPDVYCERVFTPAPDMQQQMVSKHVPLFSLETRTSLKKFDIVGFTLQYELSYTNIIKMLDLTDIPRRSIDRRTDDPFIIAGGPCAVNPAPLAKAIDFFVVGDGEDVLKEICHVHKQWSGKDRTDFLKAASKIKGIYVPELYEPPEKIKKNIVWDLNDVRYPKKPVVPIIESVHDRSVVEIFRGCTRGCRFCQAGMIYRPVRERTPEHIIKQVRDSLKNTGYDEVSLLSLATNDYSELDALIPVLTDLCKTEDVSLSLPSMRLDSFSFDTLKRIQEYKKTGLTFAPEAGTQRLRNVINKTITDDEIISAVRQAAELGWKRMKFYFMIGLPTETESDLDGIVDIAVHAKNAADEISDKRKHFSLTVSVSNFVPKPFTPFQWYKPNTEEEFREKNFYLKDRFAKIKGINFQYHDTRSSWIEILLSRGDIGVLDLIENVAENGIGFDSWSEYFDHSLWREAAEKVGIDFDSAYGFDIDERLPWDMIDIGVDKKYLVKEWEKAMNGITTPDCRKRCLDCGLQCLVNKDDDGDES